MPTIICQIADRINPNKVSIVIGSRITPIVPKRVKVPEIIT